MCALCDITEGLILKTVCPNTKSWRSKSWTDISHLWVRVRDGQETHYFWKTLHPSVFATFELSEYLFNETLLRSTDFINGTRCSTLQVPEFFCCFFFFPALLLQTLIILYCGQTSTSPPSADVKRERPVRSVPLLAPPTLPSSWPVGGLGAPALIHWLFIFSFAAAVY